MKTKTFQKTNKIALLAMMTGLVVIAQFISMWIRFGTFSITLAHIPIVIGAALLGPLAGGWLGLVFGIVVLLTGDAAPFLAVNVLGTIVTVLLKGALAGLCAGLVYRALRKKDETIAILLASIVSPVVNTGLFIAGCYVFFLPTLTEWANGENVMTFILVSLVTLNFFIELSSTLVLSPVITRLITIGRKEKI